MSVARRIGERMAAASARRAVARRLAELAATATLRDEIEEWVAAHGERPALVCADGAERLGFAGLAGRAHRWARWTILQGLGRGDAVALVLENRPERVAAWLGICEAGAVAAPIDARPEPAALAAAIAASGARNVVVDAGLLPRFEAAAAHLTAMAAVWVHGAHPMAYLRIDEALDEMSAERLRPADRRPLAADDAAIRFATPTGTSDLTQGEVLRAMHAVSAAAKATAGDRLFLPDLDLGAAALVLPGVTLTVGGVAVLGSRAETLAADTATSRATLVAWDGRAAAALGGSVGAAATVRLGLAVERDAAEIAAEAARFGATRALAWRGGGLETVGGETIRRDPALDGSRSVDTSSLASGRL